MLELFGGHQFKVVLDAQDDQHLANQVEQQDEQRHREEQVEVGAKVGFVHTEIFRLDDVADALCQSTQQRQHRQGVGVGVELEQRQQSAADSVRADDCADGRYHAQGYHVGAQVQLRLDEGRQRQQLTGNLDVAGSQRQVQGKSKDDHHQQDADQQSGFDAAHIPQDGFLVLRRGVVLQLGILLGKFFRDRDFGGSQARGFFRLLLFAGILVEKTGIFCLRCLSFRRGLVEIIGQLNMKMSGSMGGFCFRWFLRGLGLCGGKRSRSKLLGKPGRCGSKQVVGVRLLGRIRAVVFILQRSIRFKIVRLFWLGLLFAPKAREIFLIFGFPLQFGVRLFGRRCGRLKVAERSGALLQRKVGRLLFQKEGGQVAAGGLLWRLRLVLGFLLTVKFFLLAVKFCQMLLLYLDRFAVVGQRGEKDAGVAHIIVFG